MLMFVNNVFTDMLHTISMLAVVCMCSVVFLMAMMQFPTDSLLSL